MSRLSSLSLLLVAACGAPSAPPPAVVPVAPAEPATPVAVPVAAPAESALPAGPFAGSGIPGFLGAPTEVEGSPSVLLSPRGTDGQAALHGDALAAVPVGTAVTAVYQGGRADLKLLRTGEVPFGCDGIPTQMTLFSGPTLPMVPLWLTAPQDAARIKALPIQFGARAADRFSVEVGGATVTWERTESHKGKLSAKLGEQTTGVDDFEKYLMAGADESGIAFDGEYPDVGVPWPVAAFSVDDKPFLVLETHGYEGGGERVLTLWGTPTMVEGPSVYLCAF